MIWRPFFARFKVNHRRVYSCILVKVCAVAMATGLVNTGLKKWFLFISKKKKKIPVVRISRNLAKKIVKKSREWSITKNLNFDIGNF